MCQEKEKGETESRDVAVREKKETLGRTRSDLLLRKTKEGRRPPKKGKQPKDQEESGE